MNPLLIIGLIGVMIIGGVAIMPQEEPPKSTIISYTPAELVNEKVESDGPSLSNTGESWSVTGTSSISRYIANEKVTTNGQELRLYWNVVGGVGCCASYNCIYMLFKDQCLYPEFKLYDLYFDGVKQDIVVNEDTWFYKCENVVPYNIRTMKGVEYGNHTFRIVEKGCSDTIYDVKEINFELTQYGIVEE